MIDRKVQRVLESRLGPGKRQTAKDIGFFTPFARHRKRKLSVCLERGRKEFGWWHCWITDQGGRSLFTLLKRAGHRSAFGALTEALGGASFVPASPEAAPEADPPLALPDEFRPLNADADDWARPLALRYALRDRGIPPADVVRHGMGYCASGRYAGRLIVPSRDDAGDLNYFVARDVTGRSSLKYLNPQAPKDTVIFEERISWADPLVLVEGVFDAIAVRRNAVPLLGKNISPALHARIALRRPPAVYVALDGEARATAGRVAERLSMDGVDARVVPLPDEGDPADLGFERMWRLISATPRLTLREMVRCRLSD